jgi:hypothetical protein
MMVFLLARRPTTTTLADFLFHLKTTSNFAGHRFHTLLAKVGASGAYLAAPCHQPHP